jgi:Tol biopolymer transport system component
MAKDINNEKDKGASEPSGAPELDEAQLADISEETKTSAAHAQAARSDTSASDASDGSPDEASAPATDATSASASEQKAITSGSPPPKRPGKWRRFFGGYWRHKAWTLPLSVLIILIILAAIPPIRYGVASHFVTRQVSVLVMDSQTGTPVSGASVSLAGQQKTTNAKGQASLSVAVGQRQLAVHKKYYKKASKPLFVKLWGGQSTSKISLAATGRKVPLQVVNKISGAPVANAKIKVGGTSGITGKHGKITIVLPTKTTKLAATIAAKHYNQAKASVTITSASVPGNTIELTPSGRAYYLSNASGKIAVMSANLDGSDSRTVLEGTGREGRHTQLYVSPNNKYLMLRAERDDSGAPKLYEVQPGSGAVHELGPSASSFTPVGWAGDHFIYLASRLGVPDWKPKQEVLESYSPVNHSSKQIAASAAEGKQDSYARQKFSVMNIVGGQVVFGLSWLESYGYQPSPHHQLQAVIKRANADGSDVQTLRKLAPNKHANALYLSAAQPSPARLYIETTGPSGATYYVYKHGNVTQSNTVTQSDFTRRYPEHYLSPSGEKTFWTATRNGRSALLIGDADASSPKQIALLNGYTAYGWHGNQYLLVSKDNTLYILPTSGLSKDQKPLKVTNYYSNPNPRP